MKVEVIILSNFLINNKELMTEYSYDKNKDVDIDSLKLGSAKKIWWKCSRGHEWKASINHKARGQGCPYCANKAVLPGYNDMASKYPEIAAEWHPTKNKGLSPISSSISIIRENLTNTDLDRCISTLLEYVGKSIPVFVDKDQSEILAQYNTFIHDSSLQAVNPKLAAEWHPTKNGGLKPEFIPAGSGKKAWWLCPVCHGEWQTRIVERNQGRGCPYCTNQKVLVGFNDLATKSPKMAAQWHPTKNGVLTPQNVVGTSNKKIWWLCQTCDHDWQAAISSRIYQNLGCPKCGAEKGKVTKRLNRIKNGVPTLAQKYPELATEWHLTKNGDLTPNTVTYHSGLMVWWKCSICGEEWQQTIYNRAYHNAIGCAKCRKKKTSISQAKDS